MIAHNEDLSRLLSAATELAGNEDFATSESVRIGDRWFRVAAIHDDEVGWIVILMQEGAKSICPDAARMHYKLTEREIEVASLLVDRHSNREIAELLGVTVSTAERHTENVLRKLGIASRLDVRQKLDESFSGGR